jgi:hypothetical protein
MTLSFLPILERGRAWMIAQGALVVIYRGEKAKDSSMSARAFSSEAMTRSKS